MAENFDDVVDGQEYDEQAQQRMIQEQQRLEAEFKKSGWGIFARPQYIDDHSGKIQFMQIECDYYTLNKKTILRMFGVTKEGNSLLVNVLNFESFFYIQAPLDLKLEQNYIKQFQHAFNKLLVSQKQFKGVEPITKIEVCYKENIRNYKGDNAKLAYLKIFTCEPAYVASIRNFVKSGDRVVGDMRLSDLTFESNIPYALRFMVEYDIVGMGWIEVKNYTVHQRKISCCQLEIEVDCKDVRAISLDEQSDIAPLRVLSFDIECGAQKGFPNESVDPIIQIGCIVKVHNESQELIRVVFSLLECDKIPGCWVRSFEREEDMLMDFQLFLLALDPDFIIGYNIQNFDFPYLLQRAEHLKLRDFGQFSKITTSKSRVKDGKFLSKAMGMRDTKEINIEGRIQLDMMMHMMKDHKLSSFSLNNVSFIYLEQQKEDVHHSIIYKLWQTNSETRKRLAVYCLKDAWLPIQLMEKLCCIYNYAEMARVTGVPINYLFMRGQQIKVASQILRKAKHFDYIIPTETVRGSQVDYQGAFVLEPVKGFYKNPIATLDFASLYPSIMMAHNMCYCTLLNQPSKKFNLEEADVTQAPETSIHFVKPNVRKGILPMILEDLIGARKKAKNQLSQETDPFKKAVLDGRQLALKISANSVYGFTGAQVGQLPCLEISASITSFGRQMIKLTQELVEKTYCVENGYDNDAKVIYGDTDSVMVNFGVSDIAAAMERGKEAAELISKNFIKPIKLEFEKVYCPYLLMNRKRYAGLLYTKKDKYDKIDTKGIESVRRDNCFLIRKMVTQILQLLLVEKNEKQAVLYAQEQIKNLYTNNIDISELVITKSLNKKKDKDKDNSNENKNEYQKKKENKKENITKSYKQKQAHVAVAEKMSQQNQANAPAAGDRIAYIIIQGSKGQKTYETAEDPVEVLMKDLPIDYDYYVEKQIKKPLLRIFEYVITKAESIFIGEHTLSRYIPKLNENTALGKWVKKKILCMKCKKDLLGVDKALCNECKDSQLELLTKQVYKLQELQHKYHQYWTTCQGCQGSLFGDIICSNRDCEIYYKRIKVQRELKIQWDQYDKLYNYQQW